MTITLFGIANAGGNDEATHSVTPPASMQAGDLCVLIAHCADPGGALSIPAANDGGQTWNDLGSDDRTLIGITSRMHVWWAEFTGSWNGEDPGVAFPAQGGNNACQTTLIVFRDDAGGSWGVDVAIAYGSDLTSPVTITGPDPTTSDPTVAVAAWAGVAANPFSNLSGTGWSQAGSTSGYTQNVGGSDDSTIIFAYDPSESDAALANVEHDAGTQAHLMSVVFAATPSGPSVNLVQGDVTIDGKAPTVVTPLVASPPQGDVVIDGKAPTVFASDNKSVSLVQGDVVLDGKAPTLAVSDNKSVSLVQGDVAIDGKAPTVTATDNHFVTLVQGDLALSGFAPSVDVSYSVDFVQGDVTIDGKAPTVGIGFNLQLVQGDIAIEGFAPSVDISQSVNLVQGDVAIDGKVPTVGIGYNISLVQGDVAIDGKAPTLTVAQSHTINLTQGDLSILGFAPTVTITQATAAEVARYKFAGPAPGSYNKRRKPIQYYGLPPEAFDKILEKKPTVKELRKLYTAAKKEIPLEQQSGLLRRGLLSKTNRDWNILPPPSYVNFTALARDLTTLKKIVGLLSDLRREQEELARIAFEKQQRRRRDEEALIMILAQL